MCSSGYLSLGLCLAGFEHKVFCAPKGNRCDFSLKESVKTLQAEIIYPICLANASKCCRKTSMTLLVATFYKFVPIADTAALQMPWKAAMEAHDVRGTILVAPEGLNATISGPPAGVYAVLDLIRSDARFTDMHWKESTTDIQPFQKAKVRLKRETIPLGVTVNPCHCGQRVDSYTWNKLLHDPATMVIDTRNAYEVALGRFRGALNPNTYTFKELPTWIAENIDQLKHKKVAMYCTGGIRCEKSTAYLKDLGFQEVYHLQGGILQYLADAQQDPALENLWEGSCYVFDDRVAVTKDLAPDVKVQKHPTTGQPLTASDLRRAYAAVNR